MKALIRNQLKRLGLYEAARVPWRWLSQGADATAMHRRKMRRFYSQFVAKGDLCFDVGANVGDRTEIFLHLGASVVCVEPQQPCTEQLRKLFGQCPDVVIVEKALGEHEGFAELAVCEEAPTISTLFDGWVTEGRFAKDYRWTKKARVPLTTLDALIAIYGIPRFCKIDVEGFEVQVLRGLTRPIPFISFEFTREFMENAKRCSDHLLSMGLYAFQVSHGESMEFAFPRWVPPEKLYDQLESLPGDLLWGDIYARHIQKGVAGTMPY